MTDSLDFEKAKRLLKGAEWDFPTRVKEHLNAQHRALVNAAVAQERAQVAPLIEAVREWHTAMCAFNGTIGSTDATKAECDAAEERYHDAEERLEEVFVRFPLARTE